MAKLTKAGPGRPPGSQNKDTRILKDAIMLAVCEVGDVGMYVDTDKLTTVEQRGQLIGFLKWVLVHYPETFVRSLLARILPLQVTGGLDLTHETKRAYATKEELIEEMKRRGLPVSPVFANELPTQTAPTSESEQ